MDQKKQLGLKGLLANRNKGRSSKEAPKTQPPVVPLPPPPTDLGLLAMPNLKKRRPDQELEEGQFLGRRISNKKRPRTPGIRGVILQTIGVRLKYASLSGLGPPDQKWMVLPSHTLPQYGTSREVMPTTQRKQSNNLSFFLETWIPSDTQNNLIYSRP